MLGRGRRRRNVRRSIPVRLQEGDDLGASLWDSFAGKGFLMI